MFQQDPVTAYAVPFFVLFLFLELWVLRRQQRELYPRADGVASIGQGLLAVPFDVALKLVAFAVFSWLYPFRLFTLDASSGWTWVALLLADDLAYYLHHRSCHSVRLFWAGHVGHHSSQEYNFSVALRQGVGERLHKLLWWLWLPLVGFPPLAILTMMSASLVFQFFLHTQTVRRLGPLEWVLNTPSHHRVHHGSNLRYLDLNYGGILILWDRLFGTFTPEAPEEPVVFGLTHNLESRNALTIATHEYVAIWRSIRSAPSWGHRLRYLLKPPGWSHDGSTQTAAQMRAAASGPTPVVSPPRSSVPVGALPRRAE